MTDDSAEGIGVLKRQHGLFVSTCFVVGFIVGTGIFFLPGRVLYEVGGNVPLGAFAWIIGGLMIAPSVYMFSVFASLYEKVHGFVDYSEVIVGKRYGYMAGWFFAVMYQPAGYAIIAWITSGFTATVIGLTPGADAYLPFRFFIASFFMVMTFVMNYLTPAIPVKLNVATTIARMVPLVLMGLVGGLVGVFVRGGVVQPVESSVALGDASIFAAVSATAFAFNGWQAALAFNSEIKDSKRKFPVAIMIGFFAVAAVYVLYFIGIGTASPERNEMMMAGGGENFAQGTRLIFSDVFGGVWGNLLTVFMIISGLGILNACCLGMSRAMYSLGRRGKGPLPDRMGSLDDVTNVPNNSMVLAVGISFLWLMVIFINLQIGLGFSLPDFYNFNFFALLVPIFVYFMIRAKDVHPVKRFVFPSLAIGGAGFMFASYWLGSVFHGIMYTGVFVILAIIGLVFNKKSNLLPHT